MIAALAGAPDMKLALVTAPAGAGKTTLLVEWRAASAEQRPFAWLSLDASDNDPVRFLEGVIAALRTVFPGAAEDALTALAGPANLTDVVLPELINDVARRDPVVLALDDYHLITNEAIHAAVDFLLEHLPHNLTIAMATRGEPPLMLTRLRVRRELSEVGSADLRFTDEEAEILLNRILRLDLASEEIAQLQRRTEGWAAGLQLAALSLSKREDPHQFIASFAGDDRPIVDYLGFEVLDRQPDRQRSFLLQTSVLDRLSGPLCDAVLETEGSSDDLVQLERAGLFLVPLDAKREWFRYHQLFAELLRHELARTEPGKLPVLHRRAASWHRQNGSLSAAIRHATAAGDLHEASDLITDHWYSYLQRGRIATVANWLEAIGDEAVSRDPGLCLTKAWIAVNTGQLAEVARWIDTADRARNGSQVVESGVSALREIYQYMNGDVAQAVEAGRRSVERGDTPWRPVGCPVLGIALFWSGQFDQASDELQESIATAAAAGNHLAVIHASGGLAAIEAEHGELASADRFASRALELAERTSLTEHWATTMARVVRGRSLERAGRLPEAREELERGVKLSRRGVAALEIGYALLFQAEARRLAGDSEQAAAAIRDARGVVERCGRPGILEDMLRRAERLSSHAPRKRLGGPVAELTDRELSVLRLLSGDLSRKEIADALYVSTNTVKSHIKSIYRKLSVESRDAAVSRGRELGVL